MTKLRAVLAVFLALAFLGLSGCGFLTNLTGIPMIEGMEEVSLTPAADFELTTQAGQRLRMGDLQGRVVVLTFLDTNCSGDCQAITHGIKEASAQMDYYEEAGRAIFLAVTTAPEKDTVERAEQLSRLQGMPQNFFFLTGSREVVERVWTNYKITGEEIEPARLVLIDSNGKLRAYVGGPEFKPRDLRHNIRVLLSEQNLLALPLCH